MPKKFSFCKQSVEALKKEKTTFFSDFLQKNKRFRCAVLEITI